MLSPGDAAVANKGAPRTAPRSSERLRARPGVIQQGSWEQNLGPYGSGAWAFFPSGVPPQVGISAQDLQPLQICFHLPLGPPPGLPGSPQWSLRPIGMAFPWGQWGGGVAPQVRLHPTVSQATLPPPTSHPDDISPRLHGLLVAEFSICFCFLNLGFQQTCPQTIASPPETKQVKE